VAAGKLLDAEWLGEIEARDVGVGQPLAEPGLDLLPVELLGVTNGARVGGHGRLSAVSSRLTADG
jgi:hypothetical protein